MWCSLNSKPANPDYHEFSSPLQLIWNSHRGITVCVCVCACACACVWCTKSFLHIFMYSICNSSQEKTCARLLTCFLCLCLSKKVEHIIGCRCVCGKLYTCLFLCVLTSTIYAYKSVSESQLFHSSFYQEIAASVSLCARAAALNFNLEKRCFLHCDYVLMCSVLMPLERCECRRLRGMETVSVKY